MPLGIYISVPFCRSKCSFCNFASGVFSREKMQRYVDRLQYDIEHTESLVSHIGAALERKADSIYLGGGTPSTLSSDQLRQIFNAVRSNFDLQSDSEVTVECAPGTLSSEIIDALVACGVNRVSLGVQSFIDKEAAAAVPEWQLREWTSSGVVEWVGHREDISQLLSDATVVVLPSYHEGMPKVLLEAAACGRPIVTTDCPGCRDVVDHGVNGFLVPPRDPRALADTIAVLLSNPELCRKMAAASREKAEREFGVDGVVRQTMQLYSKLVGEDLYLRTLTAAAPKASCART